METITEKQFETSKPQAPSLVVKYTNFSDEDFTHTWNNVPWTFKAGETKFMEYGIANHFAKHLVNRELLKRGRDSDTSPKKPAENPFFMELYNKCIQPIPNDASGDPEKAKQDMIDKNMKASLGITPDGDADETTDLEHAPQAPATPAATPKKGGKKLSKSKKEEEFEEITPPDADLEE